jgi:monoamine oxidase
MTEPHYPTGFASFVEMGVNGEPLIKLVFMGEAEGSAVIMTMDETAVVMSVVGETMMRAAVIREMTTIFPEQRDTILENLLFRWSGGPDGADDPST